MKRWNIWPDSGDRFRSQPESSGVFPVLAGYLLFALIFTWPLLLHCGEMSAGNPLGEMWSHIWGIHWVGENYLKTGTFPVNSSVLNYPFGGSLFYVDPLGALLALPLFRFFSLPLAYNLMIVFNLVFGAFSAFILADYYLKDRRGAFLAGTVYSFSACFLAVISTGTSEAFNIGWLPLFICLFSRMVFERNGFYALMSGFALFMTVLANFYYGIFALIFAFFILIFHIIDRFGGDVKSPGSCRKTPAEIYYGFRNIYDMERRRLPGKKASVVFLQALRLFLGGGSLESADMRIALAMYSTISSAFLLFLFLLTGNRVLSSALLISGMICLLIWILMIASEIGQGRYAGRMFGSVYPLVFRCWGIFIFGVLMFSEHIRNAHGASYWISMIIGILILSVTVFFRFRIGKSDDKADGDNDNRGMAGLPGRLALFIVVSSVLILPYLRIFDMTLGAPDSLIVRRRVELRGIFPARFSKDPILSENSSRLANYFRMGKQNLYRRYYRLVYNMTSQASYLGYVALILSVMAFFNAGRRRFAWMWLICGIIFMILSLGPYFTIDNNVQASELTPVYKFFYFHFPFFSRIMVLSRFNLCVLLCFGVLAGMGLKGVLSGFDGRSARLMTLVVSVAVLLEVLLLSPAPWPVEMSSLKVPGFYRRMAGEEGDFGIIESPMKRFRGSLYYQTVHGKGITASVSTFDPSLIRSNLFVLYLYYIEGSFPNPLILQERDLREGVEILRKQKIKYILVRTDQLGHRAERVNTFLEYFLGKPSGEDGILIYRVF